MAKYVMLKTGPISLTGMDIIHVKEGEIKEVDPSLADFHVRHKFMKSYVESDEQEVIDDEVINDVEKTGAATDEEKVEITASPDGTETKLEETEEVKTEEKEKSTFKKIKKNK